KALCVILFFFSIFSSAQDLNYAHSVINTLTSPAFHGRGYVNDGCNLAADYLKHQFDSLHLQPLSKDYFQNFSFAVNTFPGKMELTVNGKKLAPGKDFIMQAASGKGRGDYSGVVVSSHYRHTVDDINNYLYFCSKNKKDIVFDFDTITAEDAKVLN